MKKKLLLFILPLLLFTVTLQAQITSAQTGLWADTSTWVGGVVPTTADNVIIQGSHTVTLNAAGVCANLTMNAGSTLNLNAASLSVPGTSWTLAPTSTVIYTLTTTIQTAPVYGNLTYAAGNGGPAANTTLEIKGNLTVTGVTLRGISAIAGTNIINVAGNVILSGSGARISGVNSSAETTASCTWNIGGNVTLSGNNAGNRIILQESQGPHMNNAVINIDGNLEIGTLSQLQYRSSTTATASPVGTGSGIVNIKGNIIVASTGVISTSTGGTTYNQQLNLIGTSSQSYTGNFPNAFPTSPIQTLNININNPTGVKLNNDVALNTSVTLTVNGTLNSGDKVISGVGAFALNSGATLITAHADGINGTLTNSGTKTLSTGANFTFNGAVAQVTGSLLPATVNNLTLNNASNLTLSSVMVVSNAVTIQAGKLNLGGFNHTANKLYLGGLGVVNDIYGSTGSTLANVIRDDYFATATGSLNVSTSTLSVGKNEITGFVVYPNPVNGGKVFISSANLYAERTVVVFDVLGKQVVSQKGKQTTIDVSHLNKGIYILKVAEEGKVATRKLVIE